MARYMSIVSLAPLLIGVLGCPGGTGKVTATGQLLKKDQPLKISDQVMANMIFVPYKEFKEKQPYNTIAADVNLDGSFQVRNIPRGKYLITLTLHGDSGDMCKGLFQLENSKLVRDIPANEPIKIDITKPTGQ